MSKSVWDILRTPRNLWVAIVLVFLALDGARAERKTLADVDLLLVLAFDVSGSVDGREFELQREGLARALTSPLVAKAIAGGSNGSIAVTVVQWSGFTEQIVKVDWERVSSASDLFQLSIMVRNMTRKYDNGATDIGGALDFSQKLFESAPFLGNRQVIDIAGDGTNNVNNSPHFERDTAVAAGININALAIAEATSKLADYFRDKVIGGAGAFVEIAANYDAFEHAMRRKLVREIEGQLLF